MERRSIHDFRVRDVMSTDPRTAAPEENLSDALAVMRRHDFHELPVIRGKELLGMVSYATILRRRNLPLTTRVDSVLVRPPRVEPRDPLTHVAEHLIAAGYRGLPVVEDDSLMGLISRSDVVGALADSQEFAALRVQDIMTPDPQTVEEGESLAKARDLMRSLDERSIPVVDGEGRLTGVVGLKDMIQAMTKGKPRRATQGERAGRKIPFGVEVRSVMSVPPITIGSAESGAEAATLMRDHDISTVAVVEDGRPVGIVTQVDLLEQVAILRRREEVLVQIAGLDEDDWWTYETLYAVIGRGLRKIGDIARPTVFNVHVVTHQSQGDRSKYSIRARLGTEHGLLIARDYDWDPAQAMRKVMAQLERHVKRRKDRDVRGRKGQKEAR
ncbi:MAG: CBS domain-containing protein [Thermoplasmata archaeon]